MYFLKDICCICLNSKGNDLKHIEDWASDGVSYLTKLTTTIPEMAFKAENKHRFVCAQCCEQIEQMFRFRIKCLTNHDIFLEYVSQLSGLSEVNCQLMVCLTDLCNSKHVHCIKEEPVEAIECSEENIEEHMQLNHLKLDDLIDAFPYIEYLEIPIKAEFKEIDVVKNELECGCDVVETDPIKIEYSTELYETSNLRHSPDVYRQCGSAFNIEGNGVNGVQSSNTESCSPKLDEVKLEHHLRFDHSYSLNWAELQSNMQKTSSENVNILENASPDLQGENDLLNSMDNSNNASELIETAQTFNCKICFETFSEMSHLATHECTHIGVKPAKCRHCSKTFSSSNLKAHERTHTGEKPYKCKHCSKSFISSGDMKVHERIHTGEKPYKCRHCSKSFITSSKLTVHGRTHTGEKPYKCKLCSKTFAQISNLAVHERIHTGEKPHKCKHCSKSFSNSSKLTRHERIHTGEKPYKCKHCSKCFNDSSTLTIHERIHTGEKPYKCTYCSKSFTTLKEKKKHEQVYPRANT